MRESYRFELDPENKILMLRFQGNKLTDALLQEVYDAMRECSAVIDPQAVIADFSSVVQVDLSTTFINQLANRPPPVPRPTESPGVLVCGTNTLYGMARMFQMLAEVTHPRVRVVRTLDEAIKILRFPTVRFEFLP